MTTSVVNEVKGMAFLDCDVSNAPGQMRMNIMLSVSAEVGRVQPKERTVRRIFHAIEQTKRLTLADGS